jgi:chromodomain-helicase-DNA-binding protein 4
LLVQGKTVQISSFIGKVAMTWQAFPALVVVPNSTVTNWVREFERWAPQLRVVPFYGEAKAREIIKKYELFHFQTEKNHTGAKFHVLIATYESLLGSKDFTSVFKSQPRWEVLVIDEGQRCESIDKLALYERLKHSYTKVKSDTSLLFRKLNELRTIHRVIMTGVSIPPFGFFTIYSVFQRHLLTTTFENCLI